MKALSVPAGGVNSNVVTIRLGLHQRHDDKAGNHALASVGGRHDMTSGFRWAAVW